MSGSLSPRVPLILIPSKDEAGVDTCEQAADSRLKGMKPVVLQMLSICFIRLGRLRSCSDMCATIQAMLMAPKPQTPKVRSSGLEKDGRHERRSNFLDRHGLRGDGLSVVHAAH